MTSCSECQEFSIGACPVRNLALHLHAGMVGAPGMVSVGQNGPDGSMPDAAEGSLGGMFVMHVGGGASYYFGRSNISATLAAGAGFLLGPPRECSDIVCTNVAKLDAFGVSVQVSVGKEYWVSDYWAIGFAGNVQQLAGHAALGRCQAVQTREHPVQRRQGGFRIGDEHQHVRRWPRTREPGIAGVEEQIVGPFAGGTLDPDRVRAAAGTVQDFLDGVPHRPPERRRRERVLDGQAAGPGECEAVFFGQNRLGPAAAQNHPRTFIEQQACSARGVQGLLERLEDPLAPGQSLLQVDRAAHVGCASLDQHGNSSLSLPRRSFRI